MADETEHDEGTTAAGEEAAVLAANATFYRAFAMRDIVTMELLWAQAEPVICVHPGWNVLQGRGPVMASWRGILSNPQQARVVGGGAVVTIRGTTATVLCREVVAGNPLIATNIFVREDGGWKLCHHHSSIVAFMD